MGRRRKKLIVYLVVALVALAIVATGVYYWMQTDPRLQPGMTEKEVSRLLGSKGTLVYLDRPPADMPHARYYVFYEQGPDLLGTRRVVTVYYDRDGQLIKYEVAPLPRNGSP
jgi:hypothetical protein